MTSKQAPNRVPADPTKWSEKSQRSPAASWTTEYEDIHYKCWRCEVDAIFSAADQRYTYEEKKAPIDQKRVLCEPCWQQSHEVSAKLAEHEEQWANSKNKLQADAAFLESWFGLVELQEKFGARPDSARKAMLRNLLSAA